MTIPPFTYRGKIPDGHPSYATPYHGWYEFISESNDRTTYEERRAAILEARQFCEDQSVVSTSFGNLMLIRDEDPALAFRMAYC